ncbi:MAG TPA: hypothetical protein HPQ04_11115 [Rhodospirillaceae bacterium]|nr:hypothetical protein [Rhodospirillaceae bacterium]
MKYIAAALFIGLTALATSPAYADADDMKWVAKCMKDNADAKTTPEVVSKYCNCMNNKMDNNETQSISTWEKSHPTEMKACEKEAGWN